MSTIYQKHVTVWTRDELALELLEDKYVLVLHDFTRDHATQYHLRISELREMLAAAEAAIQPIDLTLRITRTIPEPPVDPASLTDTDCCQ